MFVNWRPCRASHTVEKRTFSIQLCSTGRPSRRRWLFGLDLKVEKLSPKRVLEPIASLIPPQDTHPRTTPTPGTTQQFPATTPTLAWLLSLLPLLAASQRGAFLVPRASSVCPTTVKPAARGINDIFLTTATFSIAFAALG